MVRILLVTVVAPDVIEAILDGTEPDGLSLDKLYRAPLIWEEQRRALGRDPVGTGVAQAEDSTSALGKHDMPAYNAGVPRGRRRGPTNSTLSQGLRSLAWRRLAKMVKCLVSRGDLITLALARRLGWPTREIGPSVEIELPEDWAARVMAETPMRAEICLPVLRRGLAEGS